MKSTKRLILDNLVISNLGPRRKNIKTYCKRRPTFLYFSKFLVIYHIIIQIANLLCHHITPELEDFRRSKQAQRKENFVEMVLSPMWIDVDGGICQQQSMTKINQLLKYCSLQIKAHSRTILAAATACKVRIFHTFQRENLLIYFWGSGLQLGVEKPTTTQLVRIFRQNEKLSNVYSVIYLSLIHI